MSIKLENLVLASPEQMSFIIQGLRNPFNSHNKSDSSLCQYGLDCDFCKNDGKLCGQFYLGHDDEKLMQRLSKAGADHRKFMRMMPVYVRITAPLYW